MTHKHRPQTVWGFTPALPLSLFFLSQSFSFLLPSAMVTCANTPLRRHIGLDYNLICSGRDGIEHQIIPNEENQSPRVQISWKLVNSDWFRQSSRQGGIWQITASQVVGGKRESGEKRRGTVVEVKDTFNGAKINRPLINCWSKKNGGMAAKKMCNFKEERNI